MNNKGKITFRVIDYGTEEYDKFVALRQRILRDPLNMVYSQDDLLGDQDGVLLAAYLSNQIIATSILRINGEECKICQVATHNSMQKMGIGTLMMKEAERIAKEKYSCILCFCSARVSVKDFYSKNGYCATGAEFSEIGLPHIKMMKAI